MTELKQRIIEIIYKSVISLPSDVISTLKSTYSKETSELAKLQLKNILENIETAEKQKIPLCQDTGVPLFFVKLGSKAALPEKFEQTLKEAVEEATQKIPLRPNVVAPLSRKNSETNTGFGFPIIEYEVIPNSKEIEITFVPKGAGSETCSALAMLPANAGISEIKKFVLEKILEFGGKPCPPYIVGIGVGGTSELCMKLAKKATLRKIGIKSKNSEIAKLEKWLLEQINKTKIGTMGLGGDTTALAVHIEAIGEHTALKCVGINIMCWAARKASLKL